MADQQDQLSSGGSVEKASASADTSKIRGKGSSGGSSGYRKRQNTGAISDSVEEKRRRQITGDPQTSQVDGNTAHTHLIDSSKGEGRIRGERRNHGAGLESYPDTDWRSHHKIHQASYSSGSSARVRSAARTNLPELNLTPTDCVASRTRSRTPQNNPQALVQATSSYDLSLPSGYGSRKTSTYSNVVASSSTTLITSHPSTSRGRGG